MSMCRCQVMRPSVPAVFCDANKDDNTAADRPQHWDLPPEYEFVDVLGLDPELLGLVARPVHAVVFLFPDTSAIVDQRAAEGPGDVAQKGQQPLWIPQVGVGKCREEPGDDAFSRALVR